MAEILKGAPVAAALTEKLIERVKNLKVIPTLAMLRIGENPNDISYETGAVKRCEKIGIATKKIILPENSPREKILSVIDEINRDENIHACLIFRPLKDKETETFACEALSPSKDIDCMNPATLGKIFTGKNFLFAPCTAAACLELLDFYNIKISGRRVAILGRSPVIGKPLAMLMLGRDATITICHSKTHNLPEISREADIIIAAIGRANFVDEKFLRPGQIIIDVGINMLDGKLCGDVKFSDAEKICAAVTPVPGGVGAVTTAILAKHTIEAAEKSLRE